MKKILSICFLIGLCFTFVFAQVTQNQNPKIYESPNGIYLPASNTFRTTYGVFESDVDNFMDVNSWSNLNLNNMFASLSYYNGAEFGFAKKIKNSYLGLFLVGDLGLDFGLLNEKTETSAATTSTTTIKNSYNDGYYDYATDFTIGALYGKNLWGYRFSIRYAGDIETEYIKTTTTTSGNTTGTISNIEKWELYPEFAIGYNGKNEDCVFHPYGSIGFELKRDANIRKNLTNSALNTEYNNDQFSLRIGLGSSFDLPTTETLKHSAMIDSEFTFGFFKPYKSDNANSTSKYGAYSISFTPSYKLAYTGFERLSLGLNAEATLYWVHSYAKTIENTIVGTDEIKTGTGGLFLDSNLSLALAYDIIPSKLVFRTGAYIYMPGFSLGINYKKINGDSGTSKTNKVLWEGYSAPMYMNLNSGFTFNLTPTLTFDAQWDIVGDLFYGDLTSNLSTGNGTSILNTLNQIFVHQLRLAISFKM